MSLRGYKPKWKKALWTGNVSGPDAVAKPLRPVARRSNPIARRSNRMRKAMAIYNREVAVFLAGKNCEAHVLIFGQTRKPARATENHHKRGRISLLLLDKRYWTAICRECHNWIRDHVEEARKLGLIAQKGDWNRVDRTPV